MEWELKELREELYASNAINNPSYDEYKNKWAFYDAYENGWSYIYVLGVVPDDYVTGLTMQRMNSLKYSSI